MNDNETFEFENRTYINPDISRDEQTAFIDTLRGLQDEKNAQIATETHNLGTDVEPHLGGLSGSEDYWKAKYQTPQTNAVVDSMKTAAQQSALNNAMSNYSSMLQERYNQAYRDYQKRAYNHNRKLEKSNNNNTNNNNNNTQKEGNVEKKVVKSTNFYGIPDTNVTEDDTYYYYTDANTGAQTKVLKDYMKKIYNEDGSLTDDGAVILQARELLGM